jgi:hypothetical protein
MINLLKIISSDFTPPPISAEMKKRLKNINEKLKNYGAKEIL